MTDNSAETRVLAMLAERLGRHDLTPESSITADAGLDSVSVMDFVLELEDEFDTTIPLDHLSNVGTVRELGAVISRLRGPIHEAASRAGLNGHNS
ncbi:MAG: acyl carrier protein [Pseudomonadota bacterium]